MGLLDFLKDAYTRGAGILAPNQADVNYRPEIAKGLLSFVPGTGDAISGYDAVQSARQGNYGDAALNGIGLLPFVPSMGGVISPIKKQAKEAYQANKEIFDNAHKAQDLQFHAIPINQLGDAVSIYKSPRYGTKAPSEYMVAIVNGEPAYVRKSDHWGKFTTNIKEGSADAKAFGLSEEVGDQFGRVGFKPHNWELLNGVSSKNAGRIAELQALRASMTQEDQLFGDAGIKAWDELYKLLYPKKREAGYIPVSKLINQK